MSIPHLPCLELNKHNPIIHGCFLCFVQKPKVHLHGSLDHTLDSPELVPARAWQPIQHSLCLPIWSNKQGLIRLSMVLPPVLLGLQKCDNFDYEFLSYTQQHLPGVWLSLHLPLWRVFLNDHTSFGRAGQEQKLYFSVWSCCWKISYSCDNLQQWWLRNLMEGQTYWAEHQYFTTWHTWDRNSYWNPWGYPYFLHFEGIVKKLSLAECPLYL